MMGCMGCIYEYFHHTYLLLVTGNLMDLMGLGVGVGSWVLEVI
jgi:hypothetical protein